MKDAQRGEGDDRQHDVAAVHPVHLSMEPRQALQLVSPVQTQRDERGRNQNRELPDSRGENEAWQCEFHQIAPRTCMNGTMTPTTNGGWKRRPTGAIRTANVNSRPRHPERSPLRRPLALRSIA